MTAFKSRSWVQNELREGFLALGQRRLKDASACCKRVLAEQPRLVQAHFLVGLVALELKDRKTAVSAFGSVTKLKPDHVAAWAQLARLFMTDGQVARADAALDEAIKHESDDPIVNDLVAIVYALMGDHVEATKYHRRAKEQNPDHIPFTVNYANSLVYHGRTDEAASLLESVLEREPFNPQAHWILASCRKAVDESHIAAMRLALPKQGSNDRGLAFLHYAIGKEYEDLESWPEAFEGFKVGAAARRKTVEYDEAAEIAFFDALEQSVTREWFNDGRVGFETDAPIFVLGQPRTGTTLIERIITSHSAVHSAGELQQFGFAIRRLSKFQEPKRFSAELLHHALQVDPMRLGEMYMTSGKKLHGDTPRFVDKLPTNFVYIPLILKALPHARIVHLVRNPMDACFASFKQLFADAYLHSYQQDEMARHHLRYLRLMDTWRERFPGRIIDVSYEDTARDLEPNARALIAQLGLPWEDACLRFHEQKTAVSTASAAQVREPAHTRSIGRWKRYAGQLGDMRAEFDANSVPVD
ncbi:MAG TPA: sulfotransferase [Woeseiaceae bacterium]|nr:sulfotransferase [Woeseiaceae bacterium]